MSGKYYLSGNDITSLAEPRITSWAGTTKTNFSTYYLGDATAIDALHKGGSDTTNVNNYASWAYNYNGSPISFTQRGYLPTNLHNFGTITNTGTTNKFWYVERTDAGIYFKNPNGGIDYSYPASTFRNGYVPHEIFVIFVAGGGGGGGWGYYDSNGDSKGGEAVPIVGGAGGGGGVYAARVVINDYSRDGTWQCGVGGAAGSDGSTSSNSTGGAGSRGGNSGIYINGGELLGCVAKGGNGGRGGVGNSNGTGTPGSGGTGGLGEGGYCKRVATMAGGDGNNYNNITRTGTSGMSGVYITEDTGSPMLTLLNAKDNNLTSENTKSNAGSGAYFSGGCSYDFGRWPNGGPNTGGGGGSGTIKSAGGGGAIILYY